MLTIDIYKCKCVKQNLKEINSGQVLNFHFFPPKYREIIGFHHYSPNEAQTHDLGLSVAERPSC